MININDLTIGEAKELAKLFGNNNQQGIADRYISKKVIIRSHGSGVHFGTLEQYTDKTVILSNTRRLWYWSGAFTLSYLAQNGVDEPTGCKFSLYIPEILINDVIEIIPCSNIAIQIIEGVEVWKS